MLSGIVRNAGAIIAIIGTYPFAGFIKEEALQTLSFAVRTALDNEDAEGAAIAIREQEEIINDIGSLIDRIPFLNIVNQLRVFFNAAQTKLEIDRRAVERLQTEGSTGEQIARAAEERRALELEQQAEDTAFFEGAREEARQRELDIRAEDSRFFEEAAREGREEELEERIRDSQYFDLIREGKFEEASALLRSELEALKGG